MDSAINGLARQIVEGIPECWGDLVEEGRININLTVDANIMEELIEEVNRLDMPRCRICGCTDDNACPGGCYWVEEDLCSKCVETDRLQDAAKDTLDALERYAAWEAKLTETDGAWRNSLPQFTQELYDEWMEIQEIRNVAISKAKGAEQ